ncbi:MAG TPA: DUF3572 domain-containing protein [Rhizomicrobium sp.]|jgi:hypothetical protein
MNTEMAEILALQGLGWLAGDEDGLGRFLSLSGLDEGALRACTGTPDMNIAVLDFLLGHEDLLLRFCDSAAVSPRQLHLARHRLGGEV